MSKFIIIKPELIKGNSMVPIIKKECYLKINLITEKFSIGDIVLLKDKRIIVHRIIGRKNNLFLIKGDNSSEVDGFYSKEKILGKVELIIYPYYRIDLNNLKNRVIKYLFVLYSWLNIKFGFLRKTAYCYKLPFLKKIYQNILKS